MREYGFVFVVLLWLVKLAAAISLSGPRLLVVLEEAGEKTKYSQFWSDLEARGFKLSFESPKNEKLFLFSLGERAYDHLILFPPKSKGLGPALTPQALLEFINTEGNILIALSSESPTPSAVSSLLLELDIQLPPDREAVVVDHFNYDALSAADKHDVVVLNSAGPYKEGVKDLFGMKGPVAVPRAVGQVLGNGSPLLTPILRSPETAYSYSPVDEADIAEDPFATGQQLALVSSMQARNSARVSVVGSVEMLQNAWFDAKVKTAGKQEKTVNRELAKQVTAWTFKETGVLKVGRLEHYLNEGPGDLSFNSTSVSASQLNPKIYRIKNRVSYSIELSEYVMDRLIPFFPPSSDNVQLEVTMLSPFHRLNLQPISQTANSTIFGTSFILPDQHGIFNFRVNYKRPFLSNIDEKRTVTVRHFAHDEWPRSWRISGAWVWIGGIWVTVLGWLAFLALWLYSEPTDQRKNVKKSQ